MVIKKHTPSAAEQRVAGGLPATAQIFDETAKERWRERSREDIGSLTINHDKILTRIIAMAAIDFMLNGAEESRDYYDARLKPLGLRSSGDKVAMRAATLATRLDRQDLDNGKAAGKQLDAIASGIEGLVIAAGDEVVWAYTNECIDILTALVAEVGGIRKLADLARNDNIDDNPRGVIRLDAKRAAALSEQRIIDAIGDLTAAQFAIAVQGDDGGLTAVPDLSLDSSELIAVMSGKDFGESRVRALHELTQATIAISVEDTGLAKVHDQDPKDRKTGKRQTEPHIVFCPDGSVVIAAHLAPQAGNMLRITDLPHVIDVWPSHHVMLPPQVHRKLALNVAKPSQRNAIAVSEEDAEAGTALVYRTWRVRSEAALHPRYQMAGQGLKFSLRLPTYGTKGDPRDTVHVIREDHAFEPVTTFSLDPAPTGFRNGVLASHERIKRNASLKKALLLSIRAGTFTVVIGKGNALATAASGTMPDIHVAAADFRNFLLLLEALKPTEVALAIDSQKAALRWTFRSSRAGYELFMPATTATGTRSATAFQPIAIIPPPATAG